MILINNLITIEFNSVKPAIYITLDQCHRLIVDNINFLVYLMLIINPIAVSPTTLSIIDQEINKLFKVKVPSMSFTI